MTRLAILLVTRRWGLIIVGAALIIGGLIWGATSHQVSYVQSNPNGDYDVSQGTQSSNIYITIKGSDDYNVAFASDFKVAASDLANAASVTFIARSDTSTLDPALNAPDGSTITDAHKIEKLVFLDQNNAVLHTYTTAEYNANPNGFNDNNWPKAILLLLLGLIIAGAALIVPLFSKKPQANASFNIGAPGMQPQQPYAQPYQQPQPQQPYPGSYQNPEQYQQGNPYPPQQPYNPAYPPQQAPTQYAGSYQNPEQYQQGNPYPPQQPPQQ